MKLIARLLLVLASLTLTLIGSTPGYATPIATAYRGVTTFGTGYGPAIAAANFSVIPSDPNPNNVQAATNAGLKVILWIGDWIKCTTDPTVPCDLATTCKWSLSDSQVAGYVSQFGSNPTVIAWYLSDEPQVWPRCTQSGVNVAQAHRDRTAYIHNTLGNAKPTLTILGNDDGTNPGNLSFPFGGWGGSNSPPCPWLPTSSDWTCTPAPWFPRPVISPK